VSQRDGLLHLGRGYDDNNNKKKSLRTYPYGLEGFLAADSAFPLENETMTKCMQWKDQIAYRCPLGLKPPGVMNCVCVCVQWTGRRRLSPPRGAGWEPANALPDGISRAEKSHTSQHCPLARATARARAQGSGPLTPRTGDKGTI
jgi:hypothetical protein